MIATCPRITLFLGVSVPNTQSIIQKNVAACGFILASFGDRLVERNIRVLYLKSVHIIVIYKN